MPAQAGDCRPRASRSRAFAIFAWGCALLLGAAPAGADELTIEARSRALERASEAVVALHASALDGARSIATLGRERDGSGVLIAADGLVLTAGYLVLEADEVELVTGDDHRIPARVVAYDSATGFGLVQALAPLGRAPAPLGRSEAVQADEPLVMASGGPDAEVGPARLVARRDFTGSWEYLLRGALFTMPARADFSGAALFNPRGELVGIGSLAVGDALGREAGHHPGTVFLPIDLLTPILGELRREGRSRASRRPWIGVNCAENRGEIRVLRVAPDSPAEVGGLAAGDRITAIDGKPVQRLDELWTRLWSGPSAEREVRLQVERDGGSLTLTLHSIDRAATFSHAESI